MPAIVKKHFKKKTGYANYYFNQLEQKRVWDALTASGDFTALPRFWAITGSVATEADRGAMNIQLGPKAGAAELPNFQAQAAFDDDLSDTLDPPATGGLLVALHLWQRLLSRGLEDFGEVYYLGTAPLPGHDELADVLVGIHGGVEARFIFDKQTGLMLGMEMYADDYVDPCEIYFDDYREIKEGRLLPHRMQVRNGDRLYGVFSFDGYTFDDAAAE
jgi:hypothetical protein